jgi:hypothetical protein
VDFLEELTELQTIQIALDDKIHRFQKILTNLAIRINVLEERIKQDKPKEDI